MLLNLPKWNSAKWSDWAAVRGAKPRSDATL